MHNGLFYPLLIPKLTATRAAWRAAVRCLALLLLLLLGTASAPSWAAAPRNTTLARCSWDTPGTNPYRGELAAAIDHYTDIPVATRAALKRRVASQAYDDIAVIGRSHISGGRSYKPELRDMHFGNGRLCRTVTRQRWPAGAEERGLVYCEAGHCVIVPTVCRNVSRVSRLPTSAAQPTGSGGGEGGKSANTAAPASAAVGPVAVLASENAELQFDAPSAGRIASASSDALAWTGPSSMTLTDVAPDTAAAALSLLAAPVAAAAAADVSAPTLLALAPQEVVDLNGSGSFGGPLFAPVAVTVPLAAGSPPQPLSPLLPSLSNGGGLLFNLPVAAATPVPEPGGATLMLVGLAGLVGHVVAHRRRRAAAGTSAPL